MAPGPTPWAHTRPLALVLRSNLAVAACVCVALFATARGGSQDLPPYRSAASSEDELEGAETSPPGADDGPTTHRPVVRAVRVTEPPRVDGRLDDAAWKLARDGGPLVQVVPEEGAEATEPTEFRVVYDDDNLYIGVWCHDSDPKGVVAREMARDGRLTSDDYVTIALDTFLDRRNGYLFRVNPTGAQEDFLITNNSTLNEDWNGIWMARARVDEEGWKAEIALPFKSLGFDPGTTVWGFNIERDVKRKWERTRWASPEQHVRSYNVSHAGDLVGLEGLQQGWGLEVTPFALARWNDDRVLGDQDYEIDVGGDLRYYITPNLAASLSYNTDFAETEVDSRQINLTRFPLFFPEKRAFFLQDSGIFDFGRVGTDLIPFFSRRIGLSSEGEPVPIIVAGKVTGRVDDYNIGVLDAVLDAHGDLDTKNAFVGRLSKNILDRSSAGVLITHGDPNSRDENLVIGADFDYRSPEILGDFTLTTNVFGLSSYTEDEGGGDNLAFALATELENDEWEGRIELLQIEKRFDAALGFVPRRDIRSYESSWSWRPRPKRLSNVRQLFFTYSNSHETSLSNDLETARHTITPFYAQLESGDELFAQANLEFDAPDQDFEISEGVVIPAGEYWYPNARLGFETASKRPVELEFSYTLGEFYDGTRRGYGLDVNIKPIRYFFLRFGYGLNEIRLPQGDFDTRLASVRGQINFFPQLIWFHLVQYDNVSDTIGYNSRIQWEMRPGANLFVVFNQGVARDDGELRGLDTELTAKIGIALRL